MSLTKEQENEFNRIVDCLKNQGDLNVLLDFIPDDVKKQFIDDWKDEE